MKRHEVLRARFVEEGGVVMQEVKEGEKWEMGRKEVGSREEGERWAEEEVRRGFDLEGGGELLRVTMVKVRGGGEEGEGGGEGEREEEKEREQMLVVSMHHIVSDGWSIGVMVREIKELYEAKVEGRE